MAYARHSSNNQRRGRNNRGSNNRNSGRNNGGNRRPQARLNQVYDSNGPEGRVRGTASQIVDKYISLARDANGSGNKVLQQSFLQHAEHYQRILSSIQKEIDKQNQLRAEKQAEQDEQNSQDDQSSDEKTAKSSEDNKAKKTKTKIKIDTDKESGSDDKMTDVPSFLADGSSDHSGKKEKKPRATRSKKVKAETVDSETA